MQTPERPGSVRAPTRRRAFGLGLLAAGAIACAVGDDTVFVDDRGSRYAAEVFCADAFEGVRVSMVPGPAVLDLPGEARGCIRLRLAQTTQTRFDVVVNEGFVLTSGTLEAKPDCRVDAGFVGTATAAVPLSDATGRATFDDGPEGALALRADLEFGSGDRLVALTATVGTVDVRTGRCDVGFD